MTEENQQIQQAEIAGGAQHTGIGTAGVIQPEPAAAAPPPTGNKTFVYGAIAITLGILAGCAFAVIALQQPGRSNPYDLGSVSSAAHGLTGHLVLNWNQKIGYRLVVAPSDPAQRDGFALAVSSAPHPLSVDIQLKDGSGGVLCSRSILVKFDPKQAAALAASGAETDAGSAGTESDSSRQVAQALDIAQAEAQELQREHGQDLFQSDSGQKGSADSISAQGEMPCSRQAFDRTASWSFSPHFPTLDEQAALLKLRDGAGAPATEASAAATPRRRAKKKTPAPSLAFAVEGDDKLVGFDQSRGIVETSMRKFFVIDKVSARDNPLVWQDVPADIHYKCDLNAVCALRRKGAGVLYARLTR